MFVKACRTLLLLFVAGGFAPAWGGEAVAQPGLIATERVLDPESGRERLKALAARPEVARRLEALGVAPEQARSRIDALTDAEVSVLAARLDALPAGGLTTQEWLLVIIAILLLIIAL
jgi:hypothetical protein